MTDKFNLIKSVVYVVLPTWLCVEKWLLVFQVITIEASSEASGSITSLVSC